MPFVRWGMFLLLASACQAELLWHDAADDNPFAFSLSEDGRPIRLRLPGGTKVRSGDLERLYGQPGGFRILDGGVDVASPEWAEAHNFRSPRKVLYRDLSDRAGWPDIYVPNGFIALDPDTGRMRFAEGAPDRPLEHIVDASLPNLAPSVNGTGKVALQEPATAKAFQATSTVWFKKSNREIRMIIRSILYAFSFHPVEGKDLLHLTLYDLHHPKFPFQVQAVKALPFVVSGSSLAFTVSSQRMYILGKGSLLILDIRDALRPSVVGEINGAAGPEEPDPVRTRFGAGHGLLFVLHRDSGTQEVRIDAFEGESKPPFCRAVEWNGNASEGDDSLWRSGAPCEDFFIEGDFLYASNTWGGLRILDLRPDPFSPRLVDEYRAEPTRQESRSVAAMENQGNATTEDTSPSTNLASFLLPDFVLCRGHSQLRLYQVRTSDEKPMGPLAVSFVPESERFRDVIAHVRADMVALEEASAGAVIIRQHGKTLLEWYEGRHGHSPDARAVDADSRFPIWSVTKAYVTTALGIAIDAGKVELDDPVHRHIPEFTGCGLEKVTVRHLATHASGVPGNGEWRNIELNAEPGTKIQYSNVGMDILAELVARAMGEEGFGQMLQKHLFQPLGVGHSGFLSPGDDESLLIRAVTTPGEKEWLDPWGPGGRGMAGLYVSARDLAAFAELYLNRGPGKGPRVLRPQTIRLLTTSQAPVELRSTHPHVGLAWNLSGKWNSQEISSLLPAGSFGHGGGTHCYVLVCPELDLIAVKLLNRGYWPGTFDYGGDYRRFGELVLMGLRNR